MSTKLNLPPARIVSDAVTMLVADHRSLKALFKEFEKLVGKGGVPGQKAALVARICDEFSVHAQVEEEIFYPAVREAIDDDRLLDEAQVEHAGARDLVAQLRAMQPGDDLYDAKVTVLSEYIDHHVGEEEAGMFPEARAAGMAMDSLGLQIAARKEELKAEVAVSASDGYGPPRANKANGAAPTLKAAR